MDATAPINPQILAAAGRRTPAEMFAAAGRLRRKAATIRDLLADPGEDDGLAEFRRRGPVQAAILDEIANALETEAHN